MHTHPREQKGLLAAWLQGTVKDSWGAPKPRHAQPRAHRSPLCVEVGVYVSMRGSGHGEVAAAGVDENLQLLFLREKEKETVRSRA